MINDFLIDLLKSLSLLSVFLLLGTLLRAKVPCLQKLFLPANVIGGFLLLLLGPQVLGALGHCGIPDRWFDYFNLIPGVLIVPIVAAVPLGLHHGKSSADKQSNFTRNSIPLFFIMVGAAMVQYAIGYLTQFLMKDAFHLHDVFGAELAIGFVGGHGTAGTLGNLLSEMNLDYAITSQGIATTTATFGIIGGIVIGIVLINWAARRRHTTGLTDPSGIPKSMKIGYLVDSKVKNHITGTLTDFAVTGAIASLPIKAVAGYIIPILVMVLLGFIGTIAVLMLCRFLLKDSCSVHLFYQLHRYDLCILCTDGVFHQTTYSDRGRSSMSDNEPAYSRLYCRSCDFQQSLL